MVRAQGIHTDTTIILGMMISNALIALAGSLIGQSQNYADLQMGTGAIVIGLASLFIGEVLFGKRNFLLRLMSMVFGAIIYRVIIAFVLRLGMASDDLKLFTAITVAWLSPAPGAGDAAQRQEAPQGGGALMLKVTELTKIFNRGTVNERVALSRVSLMLREGDFATVIGGNGAGKSTLLNCVAGVYPPDEGEILVDGVAITKLPEYQRAKYMGRVFQDPMMGTAADMSIEENLALAYRRGERRGLRWYIRSSEKAHYREMLASLELGLEDRMTSKVGLLSGGQRQALTLLMATLHKPQLLLLDEHTAALDPKTARKVLELSDRFIRRRADTMMVTHNMRDAIRYATA